MFMRRLLLIPVFLWLILQALPAQGQNNITNNKRWWKAGVAKTVITPQEYMWMAGYAARTSPADGKLHDLWAKALALEDAAGNRVVVITTDIIGFDRELSVSVCNQLEEKYGLERRNIILSSSHTHSGPVINRNLSLIYPPFDAVQQEQVEHNRTFVEDRIITVTGRALNSLAPARIASGVGYARFAVNRRENPWDEQSIYNPSLKGPSDHVVQVLKISDPLERPLAVLFGYSCHATTLDIMKWSGDYPGFAQIEIEKMYPGVTSMFFAGFGADQNPLPRRELALAEQYGKELAVAVSKVIGDPMMELSPSIQTVYHEIELELSPPPEPEMLEKSLAEGADWQKRWALLMKEKLASGEKFPETYPYYPVQTLQLGEQTLVVLGGEVVVDYAFALRKALGNDLMVMGYANDVMSYIPSERVLQEGGYEGESSMWVYGHHGPYAPGIENKIVREAVQQVQKLKQTGATAMKQKQ